MATLPAQHEFLHLSSFALLRLLWGYDFVLHGLHKQQLALVWVRVMLRAVCWGVAAVCLLKQ